MALKNLISSLAKGLAQIVKTTPPVDSQGPPIINSIHNEYKPHFSEDEMRELNMEIERESD